MESNAKYLWKVTPQDFVHRLKNKNHDVIIHSRGEMVNH